MKSHIVAERTLEFGDVGQCVPLHFFALRNGLEVYVLPDHAAPVVSFQTWFRVGSRDELPGKTGQAHLLEHLMFNETKNHAYGEFDRKLEFAGAETNAATWCDWTYYYENVPASELALAMQLESDRMCNLVLRKKQVASELDVVASERRDRVEDDIDGALGEALYAATFGKKHPYGWPTIGWMRDIKSFSPKDCLSFYRTHYAPNGAVLVLAGDVSLVQAKELVEKHYAAIPRSKKGARRAVSGDAKPSVRNVLIGGETDSEKSILGFPIPGYASAEYAVLVVLQQLLTGGRSSRLYQLLVHKKELVNEVRASAAPFEIASIFEIAVSMRDGEKLKAAETLIWQELEKIAKKGVPDDELTKAKARLELGFLTGLETVSGRAEQLGFAITVTGDPNFGWQRLAACRAVSSADIQAVTAKYLRKSRVVRAFALPKKTTRKKAA